MDNFKYIYRILKILEKSMDLEEFDMELIGYKELDISKLRWSRIVSMLKEQEYIQGIDVWYSLDQDYPRVKLARPEITLKGLEYLNENSMTKKVHNAAKGIKELI
ncbi:MAG: YjcQ family protein [Peptostreptococcus sp.]|uniref:YjcQ family protein n=1 Tax=Peptostreptococcus TaxID=1257 RepID=UPI002914A977|nr:MULTISPECIES: YjcQ family protein [Peptostreptococcus]MDU3430801.1 YjcQ family protein [Peptostreptococcus sp.]MDU3456191.1 YjcQ family protein [Peptostreptococcus sp.]MDU5682118.1 YjcQ family protein [Peptostreptococcus sp.]MDU5739063.1 YjcQ family protein [Peptostreptococcus sp.]MDU5987808.1 YjcQ family protein [Peptostreptococcus anaerobius]